MKTLTMGACRQKHLPSRRTLDVSMPCYSLLVGVYGRVSSQLNLPIMHPVTSRLYHCLGGVADANH